MEIGNGGLSGKPLSERSTEVIRYIHEKSNKGFPIIGVGGIQSSQDAIDKIKAGADLIQIYTGFIYKGPGLIKKINKSVCIPNLHRSFIELSMETGLVNVLAVIRSNF